MPLAFFTQSYPHKSPLNTLLYFMKRRKFVHLGASTVAVLPLLGFRNSFTNYEKKPDWLLEWVRINDAQLANYASYKATDLDNKYVGGYQDEAEIPNPHSTSGFISKACCLIACPESKYYQSQPLLKDIEAAAKCMLVFQHSDGTIDLLSTNFHSTPDTAFVLENMVPAYIYLKQAGLKGGENTLDLLRTFLKNSGEALIVGGIHTPNHRWVVSAALTRLHTLFPNKRYTDRIEQWLAEHIDIDPDGQYTEKSTNSYSPIVNRSLIIMARGLNKPELLDPVRENLRMTYYYVHPNGEVVTEASNRQDKGTIGNMSGYYYCYRYMALLDKDGEMAEMCRLIEKTSTPGQLAGYLDYFLEEPMLWQELPGSNPLPTSYAKAFPYSGVVRIRRGNWDSTLLANNASWLTFHKGNAILQAMRISGSFFGKGQFMSETIEKEGDSWVMTKSDVGPYFQPIPNESINPDGDWNKMPKSKRPQSEVQKLFTKITVKENQNGVEVNIQMDGTDGVPVAFELIFRPGGVLSGVVKHPKMPNAYLLDAESGSYSAGGDTIYFGPGKVMHKGVQLRGAMPAMDAPTVYLTGFTPFNHTIQLS
jgi:hypothetical protein